MTVAFMFTSEQVGKDEYDALMKAIDRESLDAADPAGFVAHFAGPHPSGSGWQVVDVWADQESADAFYGSEQFAAVTAGADALGIVIVPWPLHRVEINQTVKAIQ